jgi:ribonuclease-3
MYVPNRSAKLVEEWEQKVAPLEALIGYSFHDPKRLREALTHRSFAHETRDESFPPYERLEFLGDAVLELIVSHVLWERFPELSEGDLTRLRAQLVKKGTLASVSRRLGLGDMLLLGKGESLRGGQERPSILADAVEALLGAVYLDGGSSAARLVCLRLFRPELQSLDLAKLPNYKNRLQELAASMQLRPPRYQLIEVEGPEHQPTFVTEVSIDERRAVGRGNSKKAATQDAARLLLESLQTEEQTST